MEESKLMQCIITEKQFNGIDTRINILNRNLDNVDANMVLTCTQYSQNHTLTSQLF